MSKAENVALYGKCNNPLGHGHRYLTEATIGGDFDERSGTIEDFVAFRTAIDEAVEPWQDSHLDLEMEEFRETPSTGENIVRALWPKIDDRAQAGWCACVCGKLRTIDSRCVERKIRRRGGSRLTRGGSAAPRAMLINGGFRRPS